MSPFDTVMQSAIYKSPDKRLRVHYIRDDQDMILTYHYFAKPAGVEFDVRDLPNWPGSNWVEHTFEDGRKMLFEQEDMSKIAWCIEEAVRLGHITKKGVTTK